MTFPANLYPPRLFVEETRRFKIRNGGGVFERLVIVVRVRRVRRESWAEMLARAA